MSKIVRITSEITTFSKRSELPVDTNDLLEEAKKAAANAFAPYSKFHVGVALKLANGEIITGNNQENISFPSGMCAERVAFYYARSKYPEVNIEAIAITAHSELADTENPITPCGACRQVMIETERLQELPVKIIMAGATGEVWISNSIQNLLPLYFNFDKIGLSGR